jgi:Dolichyl-phosphate-mannose-protein mannosyltransferase
MSGATGRDVAEPTSEPVEPAPRLGRGEILAMVVAAVVLLVFLAFSRTVNLHYGIFPRLPLYGLWRHEFSPLALLTLPAAALLGGVAWLVTSRQRISARVALALLIAAGVLTSAMVNLVRGHLSDLIRGVSTRPNNPYITTDLHFVDEYGIRGFVEHHVGLVRQFHASGTRTHPPGMLVMLSGLFHLFGSSHALRIATFLAVVSMSAAIAAWLIARETGGERSGRVAAALFVAAPGPLLLAYTSMDAIQATCMGLGTAFLVLAIHRRSPVWAAAGGLALGLTTILTYATAFVALAALIAAAVQTRSIKQTARLMAAAGIAGGLTLVVLWLALGFDVIRSFQSVPTVYNIHYNSYWILGNPGALLLLAGLPVATFGVIGLIRRGPGGQRMVLPLVLVAFMLIWGVLPPHFTSLRQGEVERTWAFLYPLLAAAAGPVVHRWTERIDRRLAGAVVAGLVILSVAQAVVIQGLWDNLF